VSDQKPAGFDFSNAEILASALHTQLLARQRAVLEHDMKNVVHGLLSGTELLAKSLTIESARVTPAECLTLLQQQLSRVQTTLHRILNEVAPLPQEPEDIDLAELLAEGAHALRHQLQLFNVQNTVPQGLKVRASRARLRDVLLFALLDCIDRAPARSRIAITTDRANDNTRVTLTVQHARDASVQIPDLLPTIAPLAELDGGRLEFTNADARERTVTLSLPLLTETDAPGAEALELLVVDANHDAADSLALLVQLDGVGAQACYGIDSAIESIRARAPRFVVVDLDGSVDSRSLLRTIRSASGQQPRVIGLSHSQSEVIPGCDAYLRKPLDLEALRRAMR
jgi:CheY-like chemotaxis protein